LSHANVSGSSGTSRASPVFVVFLNSFSW